MSMELALLLLLVLGPLTFLVMWISAVLTQAVAGEWAARVAAEVYVVKVVDVFGEGRPMADAVTEAKTLAETLAVEELAARGVDTSLRCGTPQDTGCVAVEICTEAGTKVRAALRYPVQLGRVGFDMERGHDERVGEYTGVAQHGSEHEAELGACPP